MHSIDIYYIHTGKLPRYLLHTLKNTRAFNPLKNIFLLSDQSHQLPASLKIRQILISTLHTEKHASFLGNYVHASGNSVDFERFCFSRWFYLDQAMRINQTDTALHLDSDAMIFDAAENIADNVLPSSSRYCFGASGDPLLALFRGGLTPLLTMMCEVFHSAFFSEWEDGTKVKMRQYFCDMAVLAHFAKQNSGETSHYPQRQDYFVETNMTRSQGFDCWPGKKTLKRIFWTLENNRLIPHLKYVANGELYRAVALHYKGSAKRRMRSFNSPTNPCIGIKQRLYNHWPPINWPASIF